MAFPRAPAEVPRPPAPPLTCSSSHHMLTPALATALVSLAPTILPPCSRTMKPVSMVLALLRMFSKLSITPWTG